MTDFFEGTKKNILLIFRALDFWNLIWIREKWCENNSVVSEVSSWQSKYKIEWNHYIEYAKGSKSYWSRIRILKLVLKFDKIFLTPKIVGNMSFNGRILKNESIVLIDWTVRPSSQVDCRTACIGKNNRTNVKKKVVPKGVVTNQTFSLAELFGPNDRTIILT